MDIFATSHPHPVHAAGIKLMREVCVRSFPRAAVASSCRVHPGCCRRLAYTASFSAALPFQLRGATLRLRDIGSDFEFREPPRTASIAVVSLVRNHLLHPLGMHSVVTLGRRFCNQTRHRHTGFDDRRFPRVAVSAAARAVRSHRNDSSGLHIHGVLRLISQCGAPVFQFRDLRFGIARARPIFVGSLSFYAFDPCVSALPRRSFPLLQPPPAASDIRCSFRRCHARTMDFIAAFASSVVESTPIVLPLINPPCASRSSTR